MYCSHVFALTIRRRLVYAIVMSVALLSGQGIDGGHGYGKLLLFYAVSLQHEIKTQHNVVWYKEL